MIDVIIPAYNAHNTIERTLASIACQDNVKQLRVYVVNDASDFDYSNEIKFFKNFMDIKEIKLTENGGPGVARQIGIDNSNSEYIVFIDSDDVFSNPYALTTLYNSIEETNADVVISSFYEIVDDGSKVEHEEDTIWLHGKIYKRKFLAENNIRFNDTRANEDNGFNQLIFLHDSHVEYIEDFTYIWMFNENSITRENNFKYKFDGLIGYIYNITWALELAIKDNCDYNKIASQVFSTLIAVYYYYINFFYDNNVEDLIKESKRLYEIYLQYPLSEEEQLEIWEQQYLFSTKYMSFKDKVNPPIKLEDFFEKLNNRNDKDERNMIIALCCTETWYNHLSIEIYSLLECTKTVKKVYLLVETNNKEDIPYIEDLEEKYNVEFVVINISKYIDNNLSEDSPNRDTVYSNYCFGKLLLSEVVKEDKVLYIDTDAIVRKDISNVWNYDVSNYYLAGVKDYGILADDTLERLDMVGEHYVNSGFVIFNLKKIRREKLVKKWFKIINEKELVYPDQDALNLVCTSKELYIPSMYNVCYNVTLEVTNMDLAKVFHYAGYKEDWVVDRFYAEEWYDSEEKFYKEFKNKM